MTTVFVFAVQRRKKVAEVARESHRPIKMIDLWDPQSKSEFKMVARSTRGHLIELQTDRAPPSRQTADQTRLASIKCISIIMSGIGRHLSLLSSGGSAVSGNRSGDTPCTNFSHGPASCISSSGQWLPTS